jgi:hypothetical protein
MGSVDAAFAASLRNYRHTRDAQTVQLSEEFFPVRQKLQQCSCQHIPGSTHAAVNV